MKTPFKLLGIVALSLPACGGAGGGDVDAGADPGPRGLVSSFAHSRIPAGAPSGIRGGPG